LNYREGRRGTKESLRDLFLILPWTQSTKLLREQWSRSRNSATMANSNIKTPRLCAAVKFSVSNYAAILAVKIFLRETFVTSAALRLLPYICSNFSV